MESPPLPPCPCTSPANNDWFTGVSVSSGIMAAEPLAAPAGERAIEDMGACLLTKPHKKTDVVDGDESQTEDVVHHEQVPQIPSRVSRACLTIAGGVERLDRTLERGTFYVHPSSR